MMENNFWHELALRSVSGIIVGAVILVISLPIGNRIEQLTSLAASVERSVTAITEAANIDPAQVSAVSGAVSEGATVVGEGVGDGGAAAVDAVGNALQRFGFGAEDETE